MSVRATLAALILLLSPAAAQISPDSLLNALAYRNLGPFRGGACTLGVAVPAKPHARTIPAPSLDTWAQAGARHF